MKDCNLKEISTPTEKLNDPLTELLRTGARDLIRQAVESELIEMLSKYSDLKLMDGQQAVVRNGYLPERTIQTGIGDVAIKVPKVRDRSGLICPRHRYCMIPRIHMHNFTDNPRSRIQNNDDGLF